MSQQHLQLVDLLLLLIHFSYHKDACFINEYAAQESVMASPVRIIDSIVARPLAILVMPQRLL
jgi:hypothetical protein